MKRYACSSAAGPANLSGFHQNDGHEVEQVVVRQVHQLPQAFRVELGERAFVPLEEPLDEKVILQQTTAATPFQFGEIPLVDEGVRVGGVHACAGARDAGLRRRDAPSVP